MSTVDLSQAVVGQPCKRRDGETIPFKGSSESHYGDRDADLFREYPYLVGDHGYRRDGSFNDDHAEDSWDIIALLPMPASPASAEPGAVMECGHDLSLKVSSVESDYTFCELCEARSRQRDAETREKELAAEVKKLTERLEREEADCLKVIGERDYAQEKLDLMTATILAEDIDWSDHGVKWDEALDIVSSVDVLAFIHRDRHPDQKPTIVTKPGKYLQVNGFEADIVGTDGSLWYGWGHAGPDAWNEQGVSHRWPNDGGSLVDPARATFNRLADLVASGDREAAFRVFAEAKGGGA